MAVDNSPIEWTDATWSPITGCTKVSPGCAHCYAETVAKRLWRGRPFEDLRFHEDRLLQPLRWRRGRFVFVNSMSDLFHEELRTVLLDRIFAIMALTPRHTFQILTKRADRMREYCTDPGAPARIERVVRELDRGRALRPERRGDGWAFRNVWLGVSVENQAMADRRIPQLLATPAAVRFLSCEPLLAPVVIRGPLQGCGDCDRCIGKRPDLCAVGSFHLEALHPDGIHWVIVGGESGPGARPANLLWFARIVEQCDAAQVPVFVKQLGRRPEFPLGVRVLRDRKGADPAEWPPELRRRELPPQQLP